MNEPTGIYAGFLRRFTAWLVDCVVLYIPLTVVPVALIDGPVPGWLADLGLWSVYKIGLESSRLQATLGKKALGIKVTDLEGNRLTLGRAATRCFASVVSAIIAGIGFLMAAFTPRTQALHDMMAGTLVVRAKATPEEVRAGSGTMPLTFGVVVGIVVIVGAPVLSGYLALEALKDMRNGGRIAIALEEGRAHRAEAEEAISRFRGGGPATVPLTVGSPNVSKVTVDAARSTISVYLEPSKSDGGVIREGSAVQLFLTSHGMWASKCVGFPQEYVRKCEAILRRPVARARPAASR